MKRKNAILATLACAVALCLALVGCSSGGSTSDPEEPYVGYWTFAEGSVDGTDVGDMLDQLKELTGDETNFILHLEAGGTGELDMFGEVEDITWDAEALTITLEGEEQSFELDGDQLKMSADSDYLLFDKSTEDLSSTIEADKQAFEEAVAGNTTSSTASSAATSEAIDPITVADDDTCTITITAKQTDSIGYVGYTVEIANKTDKSVSVYIPFDSTAVDGTMYELYGTETLLAGTNTTGFFYFTDLDSIDDLKNVQTNFTVYDTETYDDIASYDVTIP